MNSIVTHTTKTKMIIQATLIRMAQTEPSHLCIYTIWPFAFNVADHYPQYSSLFISDKRKEILSN